MTLSGAKHSTPERGGTPRATTPLLIDGGTGSELRRRGLALSGHCWSASVNLGHADVLMAIHADYIRAGANVVTANTFATSRFVLEAAGLGDQFEAVNRSAIDAAKRAAESAGNEVLVAASLSCMPPGFDTNAYPRPAAELAAYRELCDCFVDTGVDLILLEMMQHPAHAARAARAAKETGLPFWAGISCRLARNDASRGIRLTSFDDASQPAADVLDAVLSFRPTGISVMHTPVDAMGAGLALVRERWNGPIGAYAEIPYDEDPDNTRSERFGPAAYAEAASSWLGKGLGLLGGCCGTTPAHLRALRQLIDAR